MLKNVWQHLHTGVEHLVPKISLNALYTANNVAQYIIRMWD